MIVIQFAEMLFWFSFAAIVYTYFVYPVVLFLLAIVSGPRKTDEARGDEPSVSIVISVFNEEAVMPAKLENLARLKYPHEKLEILIGSDGSTDRTNEIIRGAPGVRLMAFEERRGKAVVLNELVPIARGEVVVFSDANTMYEPDTVARLVRHFSLADVGAVCGELVLRSAPQKSGAKGETSYWNYENQLKRWESNIRTILGASGGVYAIRKRLYHPLPTKKPIVDDFLIPMYIVRKGYRVHYESEALAFEEPAETIADEFHRKVRIGAQNFSGIGEYAAILSPAFGFASFALWSHKILRWCVPFLGIAMVTTSAALARSSEFFLWVFALEVFFFVLALLGFFAERVKRSFGLFGMAYYVVAMNLALLVGFGKNLMGRQKATWEVRR
jgi:biofilm PGA synthesis N-glycosyltransferase PgaC